MRIINTYWTDDGWLEIDWAVHEQRKEGEEREPQKVNLTKNLELIAVWMKE